MGSFSYTSMTSGQTAQWTSQRPYASQEIWAGGSQTQTSTGTYASTFSGNNTSYAWEELAVAFNYSGPAGPTNLKSLNTNLKANIKSINGNLIANVKSLNTIT